MLHISCINFNEIASLCLPQWGKVADAGAKRVMTDSSVIAEDG